MEHGFRGDAHGSGVSAPFSRGGVLSAAAGDERGMGALESARGEDDHSHHQGCDCHRIVSPDFDRTGTVGGRICLYLDKGELNNS